MTINLRLVQEYKKIGIENNCNNKHIIISCKNVINQYDYTINKFRYMFSKKRITHKYIIHLK